MRNDSLLLWTTPRNLNSPNVRLKIEAENVREVTGYDVLDEDMAILNPPPVISALPDTSFDNSSALYFALNPFVHDNNDKLIHVMWTAWCAEPNLEIIINNENKWCTIIAREIAGAYDVILTATDPYGDSASDTMKVVVSGTTAITGQIHSSIPEKYVLNQNYPNPFNPQTTFSYGLPEDSEVRILVFNMAGVQVAELYNGRQSAGLHTLTWNALDQTSGVYFIRMMAAGFSDMKKCILMK